MRERGIPQTLSLRECVQSAHDLEIISEDDYQILSTYADHYNKAIAVDDFDTPAVN